jgi:hypothetical protein
MILLDISSESASRLTEVHQYLNHVRSLALSDGLLTSSTESLIAKGLFFVHLYGALEYTVRSCVRLALHELTAQNHAIKDYNSPVLSLVLDAELRSLAEPNAKTSTWKRRRALFDRISSSEPASFDETLWPIDGGNIRYEQLQSVWETFGISGPVLPRMEMKGLLEEVAEKRNAIAHGRESAKSVGRSKSLSDLEAVFRAVSEECSYVIDCFETYLSERHCLANYHAP